tara:strand:- start:295 stop:1368 length:1074 start_codon:yes stop_codon:yes gene_type:complete
MALVVADRVKETTTTTGTGAITLAGATTNFVTFSSVLSDGDTTYYAIVDDANTDFEVGLGTYASSGNTLTRTTVLASTNSGSAVNLSAGSKEVFITYPADKSVNRDASGNVSVSGGVTATSFTGNVTGSVTGAVTATQVDLTGQGDLRLQDSAGGQYVALQAAATVGSSYTLTLPTADGSADQFIKTDGSGALSFASVSAGATVVANANLSGSSVSFTGIPSGVSHVWINIHQASTSSSNQPCSIRLGTSSGILTSGYHNSAGWVKGQNQVDTTDSTQNLMWMYDAGSSEYFSGVVHLAKQSNNTWVMSSMGASSQSSKVFVGGGGITLSAELTQLQVNCNNGFQNFDNGTVSISYM